MIDQGLKERLTGAIVLVLSGVIFIPLFLDGPDPKTGDRETRTLALPATDKIQGDDVAAGDVPGAGGTVQNSPGDMAVTNDKRQSSDVEAGDGQAKARRSLVVPDNPLSAWAVQVGSFASQDNAERLSAELKKRGYRAFVTRLRTKDGTLYRVRVGPEQERERAELLARRLKKDGQAADVVTHP